MSIAPRTLMLAMVDLAAAVIFLWFAIIDWCSCISMFAGAVAGGWLGVHAGKRLLPLAVRLWTLAVMSVTTIVLFIRVNG